MVHREQHPDQGSALLRIYERLQAPPLQEGDLKLGLYRDLVCNHRVTVLARGDDVKPTAQHRQHQQHRRHRQLSTSPLLLALRVNRRTINSALS